MENPKNIMVLTVENVPNRQYSVLGCVTASTCLSKSIAHDVAANLKNWTIGGELNQYTEMIEEAVDTTIQRMQKKAAEAGADAVIAFRLSTTGVSEGAAEIIGYGTAVQFK